VGKGGYEGPVLHEDPVRKSIDKEEISRMLDMLEQRLHPSELEAIRLRYHKELAVEDIAQHMGVESKTVTRYVSVGLKKIRDFLQKTEGIIHDHP
jgi:RNA polymerase sigma factor (sigma-70 family)